MPDLHHHTTISHSIQRPSRRQFLATAAKAGFALCSPMVLPASTLGRGGAVAPSDRIVMGGIGIGYRGSVLLRSILEQADVHFVAVCDVKMSSRDAAKRMVDNWYGNSDCTTYRNMQEFLDIRRDIDALVIATGDRWHALASVMAMRAGKDIYCEKPSCMTIAEGQAVVATARRYERVYQAGMQRRSEANFILASELARTGRLGKLHTVRAQISPYGNTQLRRDWLPAEPEPPEHELDWDAWLGPCPWRPYNAAYVRFQGNGWREHYDFHTGCIGEWGSHTISSCQAAVGIDDTPPVAYKFTKDLSGKGLEMDLSNGIKLVLHRGEFWHGSGSIESGGCAGVRYEGSDGWISVADGYTQPEISAPALRTDFNKTIRNYVARTQRPLNHLRDFLDCVKLRRQPVANPVAMHTTMTAVHAANICMWLKRDLKCDPATATFLDDSEANRLRSRAMRVPWVF